VAGPELLLQQHPLPPARLEAEELQRLCLRVRRDFYSVASMAQRMADPVNRANLFMARMFPSST